MGMCSEVIARSKSNLEINKEDRILLKCLVKEGTVILPDNIKCVSEDAFDGCENVRINYSQKYVERKLQDSITEIMETLEYDFKEDEDIDEDNVILVFDIESGIIKKAVEESIFWTEFFSEEQWSLKEIEASKIQEICNQIALTDYKLPEDGFGILLIKNLSKEIYDNLPKNFIYNLLRNHKFYKKYISPKWIVMIEVGEGVSFPASEFVGNSLQGAYYYNLSPERYMKDMELAGKVIKIDPVDSKTDFDKDTSEQDTQIVQEKEKEIDWEERHFQICLALISRADLTSLHANHVSTKEIVPAKIIKLADKMIEALKKNLKEQIQK